jgi:hypothetical protein
MLEHDPAVAVRYEHDRLLSTQQAGQDSASAERQAAREIGRQDRQRAR